MNAAIYFFFNRLIAFSDYFIHYIRLTFPKRPAPLRGRLVQENALDGDGERSKRIPDASLHPHDTGAWRAEHGKPFAEPLSFHFSYWIAACSNRASGGRTEL